MPVFLAAAVLCLSPTVHDGDTIRCGREKVRIANIDASLSAEDTLFNLFTDDEVKRALEELPDAFRLPVLLADVEGFSYKEIAEMLDIPIGTVMSRLHRGRKAMQKALTDYATQRGILPRAET